MRILAASVQSSGSAFVSIEARSDEVFTAVFESGSYGSSVIIDPGVYVIHSLLEEISSIPDVTAVGSGQRMTRLPANVRQTPLEMDMPSPSLAAVLGRQQHAATGFDPFPTPIYLRGFNQKALNRVT